MPVWFYLLKIHIFVNDFVYLHMFWIVYIHVCTSVLLHITRRIYIFECVLFVSNSHLRLHIIMCHPHNPQLSPHSPRLMFLISHLISSHLILQLLPSHRNTDRAEIKWGCCMWQQLPSHRNIDRAEIQTRGSNVTTTSLPQERWSCRNTNEGGECDNCFPPVGTLIVPI